MKIIFGLCTHSTVMHTMPLRWRLRKKMKYCCIYLCVFRDADKVFEGMDIPSAIYKDLLSNIQRRLMPQKAKIRADIDVTCYSEHGVDAIKEALTLGEALSTEAIPLKVKLVAPPLYVMMTQCYDKVEGIALMERAILEIEKYITGQHGACVVKMKPKAISDTDEMELESLMKRAELENAEISGDEDDSEEED